MNKALKNIARRLLLTKPFSRYFVNHVPVESWPSFYARAQTIKLPSLIKPLPAKTAECGSNIKIIFKLMKSVAQLPGDLAECGVYQGATLVPEGVYLKQNKISKSLCGCDSFEGFDEAVLSEIALGGSHDPQKKTGGFSDTSLGLIQKKLRRLEVQEQVYLLKGYFQDTLHQLKDRRFCFVHLDCDLYDSYKTCLAFFYPRLVPGGIILLDEYNDPPWPGCNKAVDEFLQGKQEKLIEIESDNFLKYYIQKI
jgi:O-methyltransferase